MSEEFHEGDLVEAVKGEESHKARVLASSAGRLCLPWLGVLDAARNNGFTLTVVEKAASRPWLDAKISETWRLLPHGVAYNVVGGSERNWFTRANVYGRVENVELTDTEITSAVMLEPVPVTAKRIIDWAESTEWSWGSMKGSSFLKALAAQFGVTE